MVKLNFRTLFDDISVKIRTARHDTFSVSIVFLLTVSACEKKGFLILEVIAYLLIKSKSFLRPHNRNPKTLFLSEHDENIISS